MQRSVMFYVICIASQAVIDIRYSTFEREIGHQKSSHDSSLLSMRTKKTSSCQQCGVLIEYHAGMLSADNNIKDSHAWLFQFV